VTAVIKTVLCYILLLYNSHTFWLINQHTCQIVIQTFENRSTPLY